MHGKEEEKHRPLYGRPLDERTVTILTARNRIEADTGQHGCNTPDRNFIGGNRLAVLVRDRSKRPLRSGANHNRTRVVNNYLRGLQRMRTLIRTSRTWHRPRQCLYAECQPRRSLQA
jgi:hypothetical protein